MKMVIKISRETEERFRAWCPSLPGCSVQARSHEEALKKLNQAVTGYLASLDAIVPDKMEHKLLAS